MADWTVLPMPSCGMRAPLVARVPVPLRCGPDVAHPATRPSRGSPGDGDGLAPPAFELVDGLAGTSAPQPEVEVDGVAGQGVVGGGLGRPWPDPTGPDRAARVEVDEPRDVGALGTHEEAGRRAG